MDHIFSAKSQILFHNFSVFPVHFRQVLVVILNCSGIWKTGKMRFLAEKWIPDVSANFKLSKFPTIGTSFGPGISENFLEIGDVSADENGHFSRVSANFRSEIRIFTLKNREF